MNKKGLTIIELMIVIVIIGILVGIVFPNMMRAKVESNHAFAKSTLNTMSKALEMYYNINAEYPANMEDLLTANPPYLNDDYFTTEYRGYNYTLVELHDSYYKIKASPVDDNTGVIHFELITGGIINEIK